MKRHNSKQARSQDFAKGGGAFLEAWKNSKQTWPKIFTSLESDWGGFLSKLGDLRKKKIFTKIQAVFAVEIRWSQ